MNSFNGLSIIVSHFAHDLVPRSDRKQLRARRKRYRSYPKSPPSCGRKYVRARRPELSGHRRCAPRLWSRPAAFVIQGKLVVHPALYEQLKAFA